MKYARTAAAASTLIASMMLAACGGGGDDAPAPPPAVTPTTIPADLSIKAAAVADVGSPATFDSSASALSGLSFAWNFGDGKTSTEASPKHDYAQVGDYEVRLKVSNAAGSFKELSWRVSVNNRSHVRGLNCSDAADSGWCWQQPRPSGNALNDVFFLDALTGWRVGDSGEILKTVDGGKSWLRQNSGLRTPLTSVKFLDAKNGWAQGSQGALLKTVDGGANWVQQGSSTDQADGARLHLVQPNTVLLVGGYNGVRVSTDGGASWANNTMTVSDVGPDGSLWNLSYYGLSRSTDQGKTATEVLRLDGSYSPRLSFLDDTGRALLVSNWSGSYDYINYQWRYTLTLQRSLDGGNSWERFEALGLSGQETGNVSFADKDQGLMILGDKVYRSVDGGRNWQALANEPQGSTRNKILAKNTILRAIEVSGQKLRFSLSEDAGQSWAAISLPGLLSGYELDYLELRKQAPGVWTQRRSDGSQSLSTDGMANWQVLNDSAAAASRALRASWFFDAKRGQALNAAGELLETSDGGLQWSVKLKGLQTSGSTQQRFQFINASKGWLLNGDGKVYRTLDGGASWSTPLQSSSPILAFQFVDENNGFALAYASNQVNAYLSGTVVLATTDGGLSWTQRAADSTIRYATKLAFSNAKQGLLVGSAGRIFSTEDGGQTWTPRFSGSSQNLTAVRFTPSGEAWVTGDSGALLQSTDGGKTWVNNLPASTQALRDVFFLDAKLGWAVGDQGAVLSTTDGGKSWRQQFSGSKDTLNQVLFVDARTGWISGAGGSLLATGTGGN
ncbi:hypothetical protein DBR47_10665 [Paucibacter sp. KBW04]|uniref:YCF48-related protein n=1 Tax=Paucibacter sp. KBW04 TaxID=2153361 RepID=UPI000F577D22|nr:YCF48-related protein [Paucibacter sp. KBW04]RQO59826.1 hypothetical protein DBR47_10665 [Paucibacter sp. KBW04]